MNKQELMKEIERIELLIKIYSDRDRVRLEQLEASLTLLHSDLLNILAYDLSA